jgi:hypothetical protein
VVTRAASVNKKIQISWEPLRGDAKTCMLSATAGWHSGRLHAPNNGAVASCKGMPVLGSQLWYQVRTLELATTCPYPELET